MESLACPECGEPTQRKVTSGPRSITDEDGVAQTSRICVNKKCSEYFGWAQGIT